MNESEDEMLKDLPEAVLQDLNAFIKAKENHDSCRDCYWGELYGTLNSFQVAGLLSKEKANYIREKYLEMEVNPNQ